MAKKKKEPNPMDLATLDLARAILLGDEAAAAAALAAGGRVDAFWLDGKTKLSKLAEEQGLSKIVKEMNRLATPEVSRRIPSFKEARDWWSQDFINFALSRAHNIEATSILLGGGYGSDLPPFATANAALRFVVNAKRRLEDAFCGPARNGQGVRFFIRYGADWVITSEREKRKTGFQISFTVDSGEWELVELYREACKGGVNLDPSDPSLWLQKDWEGQALAYAWINSKGPHSFDKYIKMLRKGGSPFAYNGAAKEPKPLYRLCDFTDAQFAYLDRLREEVGPKPGWHVRIVPLLTDDAVKAGLQAAELGISTPLPSKGSRKKSAREPRRSTL